MNEKMIKLKTYSKVGLVISIIIFCSVLIFGHEFNDKYDIIAYKLSFSVINGGIILAEIIFGVLCIKLGKQVLKDYPKPKRILTSGITIKLIITVLNIIVTIVLAYLVFKQLNNNQFDILFLNLMIYLPYTIWSSTLIAFEIIVQILFLTGFIFYNNKCKKYLFDIKKDNTQENIKKN